MTEWWSGDNIGNLRKEFIMRIGKIAVAVIGLVPFNVYGECTPTPDCASIGYTETSCEGDYLACPFDSTKLKCIPCDSSYRYNCSGKNITGGTGSACGGKYVSCECAEDTFFNNGICACDTSCKVGAIYYSDKTCSSCLDTSKTAIGIVVKDNTLVINNKTKNIQWGGYGIDISTLTNYSDVNDAKTDFNGKDNTAKIVAHFGEDVDPTLHAGVFCYTYTTEGTNSGDWYLPAVGELYNYVYSNYSDKLQSTASKLGWDIEAYLWASTEVSSSNVWIVSSSEGKIVSVYKANNAAICFLEL